MSHLHAFQLLIWGSLPFSSPDEHICSEKLEVYLICTSRDRDCKEFASCSTMEFANKDCRSHSVLSPRSTILAKVILFIICLSFPRPSFCLAYPHQSFQVVILFNCYATAFLFSVPAIMSDSVPLIWTPDLTHSPEQRNKTNSDLLNRIKSRPDQAHFTSEAVFPWKSWIHGVDLQKLEISLEKFKYIFRYV